MTDEFNVAISAMCRQVLPVILLLIIMNKMLPKKCILVLGKKKLVRMNKGNIIHAL